MDNIWQKLEPGLGKHPYPRTYFSDVRNAKAVLFNRVSRVWPGCNTDHFIYWFLHTETQKRIDEGYPHWMTLLATELTKAAIMDGYQPVYTRPALVGDMAYWAGMVYTHYQWEFDIYSDELVEWMPPYMVASLFYPWHEASISNLMLEYPYGCDLSCRPGPPDWADPTTYKS